MFIKSKLIEQPVFRANVMDHLHFSYSIFFKFAIKLLKLIFCFIQASDYLRLPSYVKDIHVKADNCSPSALNAYLRKDADFTVSLESKKSHIFVVSNFNGGFSGRQYKIRFLNKIKSGTARVR